MFSPFGPSGGPYSRCYDGFSGGKDGPNSRSGVKVAHSYIPHGERGSIGPSSPTFAESSLRFAFSY